MPSTPRTTGARRHEIWQTVSRELRLIGSRTARRGDRYSDLDLVVVTKTLSRAVAARLSVLREVGEIDLDWTTDRLPTEWWSTLLFAGESCCHKVDLYLVGVDRPGDVVTDNAGGGLVLWQQEAPATRPAVVSPDVPTPEAGTT